METVVLLPTEASWEAPDDPSVRAFVRPAAVCFSPLLSFLPHPRHHRPPRKPSTAACAAPSPTRPAACCPGVSVTITSKERNTSDTVVTDSEGVYRKERLLPGVYEIKADLQGFKQAVVANVVVGVDAQANADFSLAPGAISESVEVTATSPLLKTDRADVATTFESKQITDLPVLDRNFTKFILLTPGAQQQNWGHAASENPAGLDPDGGQRPVVQRHQLSARRHGQPRSDPRHHRDQPDPRVDRRGQDHLAELRRGVRPGGRPAWCRCRRSRAATRFHGSGFEFYQSDRFQSRNPFTQSQRNALTGKFLPDTKKNQFGGSLGGQIVENKVFFFGDYQGRRNTEGGSRLLSRADRGGAERRSQRLRREHLRSAHRASRPAGQQFPNNVIPTARLSPQAQSDPGADSAPQRPRPRQRHARELRGVGLGDLQRGLVQRPHRRPARQPAPTPSAATAAASSCATARPPSAPPAAASWSAWAASRTSRTRAWPTASTTPLSTHAAGGLPLRLLPLQRQRAAVRLRHDAGRRRRHPGAQPRQHASPRGCPRATSIATATAASSSAPASTPTAATARSSRTNTSSSSSATSPSSPAATRSRPASTCAARTTCGCRATRTARAS